MSEFLLALHDGEGKVYHRVVQAQGIEGVLQRVDTTDLLRVTRVGEVKPCFTNCNRIHDKDISKAQAVALNGLRGSQCREGK